MFCTKCGSFVEDDQCYCRNCGKYLGKSEKNISTDSNNSESDIKRDNGDAISNNGTPNYSVNNGAANYPVNNGAPNYSVNNGAPNYSVNNGASNYPVNNGVPNYPVNNGVPNYPVNNGMPNYPVNNGVPNYPVNNGMPNYPVNNGVPNYPVNNGMPNYPVNNGASNYPGNNMMPYQQYNYPRKNNNKILFTCVGIGIAMIILIITSVLVITFNSGYYFSSTSYADETGSISTTNGGKSSPTKKGKYTTSIVTDNEYHGVTINSREDAVKLVVDDSVAQKKDASSELIAVEDEIINNYGIMAVNFGEIDVEFAKELSNVVNKVYTEFPATKDVLTNFSIANITSMSSGTIAAFFPVIQFATSNTATGFPVVLKTQVHLNAPFFLNKPRLEESVKDGSSTGHFPPNATLYSPLAHEYGHVISFIALLKHYNIDSIFVLESTEEQILYDMIDDFKAGDYSLAMITEAYQNYKRDTNTTLSLDRWRATISKYAVTRNEQNKFIYDETIAEAFHDIYLNGNNAQDASKYIMAVVKSKLEG